MTGPVTILLLTVCGAIYLGFACWVGRLLACSSNGYTLPGYDDWKLANHEDYPDHSSADEAHEEAERRWADMMEDEPDDRFPTY